MKEYIERAAAMEFILGLTIVDPSVAQYANAVYYNLQSLPAADVVEVRHGRWVSEIHHTYLPVEYDDAGDSILHEYTSYRCSLCGREEAKKEPYCHCGACMDKEDEHEAM